VVQIKTEQALVSLETRMEAEELEAYLVLTVFSLQPDFENVYSVVDPDPDPSDP
jgi:hypothetical protein